MEIQKLLKDNPGFHRWEDGSPVNFGVSDKVVTSILAKLESGFVTLEIEAGESTFAFLMAGCTHIALAPDPEEEIRIRQYCEDNKIETDFTFNTISSPEVLPALIKTFPVLDFVFVEGAHPYPCAEIDYHLQKRN